MDFLLFVVAITINNRAVTSLLVATLGRKVLKAELLILGLHEICEISASFGMKSAIEMLLPKSRVYFFVHKLLPSKRGNLCRVLFVY